MKLQLDFVSDVSCPWCLIGYLGLAKALEKLPPEIQIILTWQPFEINPEMAQTGEAHAGYLSRKYGMSSRQRAENIATITQRGKLIGFDFMPLENRRVYNSFNCHRLLHLAKLHRLQTPLKIALFNAYFGHGVDISDISKLSGIAIAVGLEPALVSEVLSSDLYADEVRRLQAQYKERGVKSVPMLIVNGQYGISGAQTPAAYLDILEKIINEIKNQAWPLPHQ